LVVWAATMGLVAHGSRRRDLWVRAVLLAIAFGFAIQGVHGVATSFTLAAVARFRWRRVLPTRRLLRLTALDLLLLVLLWWPLPGSHARDTAPLRALVRFEGWGYAVGSGYAFYALFAL